jgi:hypothetical protein
MHSDPDVFLYYLGRRNERDATKMDYCKRVFNSPRQLKYYADVIRVATDVVTCPKYTNDKKLYLAVVTT